MTRTKSALVIGGGIGGPVAALALRKAGIEARAYEAYNSTADGVGGALSIAPNGLNALDVVGAAEPVLAVGTPIKAMAMENWRGKPLGSFGMPPGLPDQQLVWRPDLYRALYDTAKAAGVRVEHGKRLVTVEEHPDGVTAHFADGSQATADILIGADGIRSTVRELIDPAAPKPRYAGLLGFGARLARTDLPSTGGTMYLAFGKRAFFGYQVHDDGTGGWFANLPRKESITPAQAKAVGAEEWLRVLREVFADDRIPALQMLRKCHPEDLVITGALEDIPSVPTWSRGRMVLIGDAAHATSPSSGQGASLAAESAVVLAKCLRDLPHDEAFAAYERLRRERVEKVIKLAAQTNSDKAAGPVARVIRDLVMPLVMKLGNGSKYSWQFEYTIDWDAPVTVIRAPAPA